ncbi:hypothetical protein [uncultured Parasphingorhabdus sp.]|uniref:hypothetical protein n=1 Tax=uncultured Parasphingorhabdus sp. TaxID=2709694 RepID=UPI0030D710EB
MQKVKLYKTTIFALARSSGFCETLAVVKAAQDKGNEVGASFDGAWDDVRADATIQFVPSPAPRPPEIPQWWQDFLDWLGDLLRPLFEMVAAAWPILRILLLVLLAAAVLTLLWIIIAPYVEQWRGRKRPPEDAWQPQPAAARELLAQAEALAAEGQFDQAVRLLLHHSIADIEQRRPDLLRPSNTSREIERFDSLPETARSMFAVIVGQVERGIFAALPIDESGWQVSRDAYAGFALKESWRSAGKG